MPGQGRLGDKASVSLDMHGCPACPHPAVGPAIQGSPDVNVNRRPALRVGDPGIHAACCGPNTWTATHGSMTVFVNGHGAHRIGDQTRHCGGLGRLIEGSPNVIVGESSSAGVGRPASSGATVHGAGGAAAAGGAGTGAAATAAAGTAAARETAASDGAAAAVSDSAPADETSPPSSDSASEAPPELTWIEIELLGEDDRGVAGERYVVILPDGGRRSGTLDHEGQARIPVASPGSCQVSFPDLDSEAWETVHG